MQGCTNERSNRVCVMGSPRPHIYRGRGGGCAPSRVPTPRGAAAPNPSKGGGHKGEEREA